MRKGNIRFNRESVVKADVPSRMCVEVEKTIRAYKIAGECGLFRVPRVLEYDHTSGTAAFERIEKLRSIRELVKARTDCRSIAKQLGRALAAIHRDLMLPPDMTYALPQELCDQPGEVYIHGDFNAVNICYTEESPNIVVLDWQMTSRHGGKATYGTRYFDLVWFINYLIWAPSMSYLICDPVTELAESFVVEYFREAGLVYDPERFAAYASNFFESKRTQRQGNSRWDRRLLQHRSQTLTDRLLKTLEALAPI